MHLWLRGGKNVLPDVLLLWCCHNKNTLRKKAAFFDPIKWFFEKEVQNACLVLVWLFVGKLWKKCNFFMQLHWSTLQYLQGNVICKIDFAHKSWLNSPALIDLNFGGNFLKTRKCCQNNLILKFISAWLNRKSTRRYEYYFLTFWILCIIWPYHENCNTKLFRRFWLWF